MDKVARRGVRRPALRGITWMWVPLAIFAASRVVSTVLLLVAGRNHVAPPQSRHALPSDPSLAQLLGNWDGAWYELIATEGYPADLPRTDGAVTENQWAFYPLFPGLVRLLMVTGVDFVWAASIVAMACSAAACVVLFDLLRARAGTFTASMGVATVVLGPIGPIFQSAYTEGPAMLLVLLALRALAARRWGAVVVCGLLLAFTRPITLPLAAVCAVTWAVLWWRRESDPFPVADRVRLGAATVVVGASFLAWPTVAGLVTGERDAYRLTQTAWLHGEGTWTTWLSGAFSPGGTWVTTVVALLVLAFVVWVSVRGARTLWPPEAQLWAVLYTLYILAATRPVPSVLRYLTLAVFPCWPLPELSERCRSTRSRLALAVPTLAVCLLGQWWWTSTLWLPRGTQYATP